jgi:F1F0 ATPase subunit 2
MTMPDIFGPGLTLLFGILLGVSFFGGLWWTVTYCLSTPRAGLWFTGSLVIRAAITAGGFYIVSHDRWMRMLFCLTGFILARFLVTGITAKLPGRTIPAEREAHHAHQS